MARGQNWNIPYKWYNYIYETYDVILEGFASPLNSQLMLLGDNTNFCSLFKDTDGVFGSLGNLFKLDIKKYAEEHNNKVSLTLNPPYIEKLMDMMVDLIDRWFTIVPKLRIFTGLPYWPDATSLQRLQKHKYLKFTKLLKRGEFYYENSLDKLVPRIYHAGGYEIYVLANYEKDKNEPEYESTLKYFKPPYQE